MVEESGNHTTPTATGRTLRLLFLVGIFVVSINLRPAIVTISPLLEHIRADIAVSYTIISLLITIPTLMMGVFAFLAPSVARRLGRSKATLAALGLLVLAIAIRVAGRDPVVLFGSAVVAGIGIATGQAFLPALVGDYFPDRTGFATGLYSSGLIAGAGLAAGVTVPVRDFLGSWPLALASWAIPAIVALVIWSVFVLVESRTHRKDETEQKRGHMGEHPRGIPWRNSTAWLTVLLFAGQAGLFYAVSTWLPPLYVNEGLSAERAGLILLSMFAVQPFAALIISNFADRVRYRQLPFFFSLGSIAVGLLAVAVIPLFSPFLWAGLLGVGLGGMFSLALKLPVDHAATPDGAQRLTSMTFGVGYIVAASGPLITGYLRDIFGNFQMAFFGLVIIAGLLFLLAVELTDDRLNRVK